MTDSSVLCDFLPLAGEWRRRQWAGLGVAALAMSVVLVAFILAGAFDPARYSDAAATLLRLAGDSLPPDFGRWREWRRPLAETLATGVAGTALGALLALPLAALAAENVSPSIRLAQLVRLGLNALRSLPGLIWGVVFVAAVGFGPLPGVLALGAHSCGMLGKLFFEAMEHVDPGPGAALRANGVSALGVFRFVILPQALPRLTDALIYRLEHNLRAATTLGLVGAGGLGLEIVTAFHLFEYREASALILVLLALVTLVNFLGATLRRGFLNRA
ncbi:phosphonate ABC transporter, permease protein PhnE [Methylocystis bryophila]|uniref:Phosphonate ABC transporter, permease protein PhnE n=1 Tax=Methylocystis bryophila TaxID=655015 RepID=A0A1W6N0W9_9HYPH|nr:phosphonate ABC transporter, permease protein PhnE [Methylocystis bryophila]ARN83446.1 phosphonate ABC transporter, permease protein PhnE [Methylocystis bryophila]